MARARRHTPPTRTEIADAVAAAKAEIVADVIDGRVPVNVPDYAELHEYLDANVYVESLTRGAHPDRWLPAVNRAEDQLDAWIRAGGLASAVDAVLARR